MLVKALVRAWRWQKLPGEGVHRLVIEIAEAARISKSGVSQILRLAPLALDVVVEAILGGWVDQGEMLAQPEQPLPLGGRSSGST